MLQNFPKIACGLVMLTSLLAANSIYADGLTGVWSTRYGCGWLEENAYNRRFATETSTTYSIGYLDNSGINGVDWGCSFNTVTADQSGVLNADSRCWSTDEEWNQQIILTKDADSWVVVIHEDHDDKVYLIFDTQCDQ